MHSRTRPPTHTCICPSIHPSVHLHGKIPPLPTQPTTFSDCVCRQSACHASIHSLMSHSSCACSLSCCCSFCFCTARRCRRRSTKRSLCWLSMNLMGMHAPSRKYNAQQVAASRSASISTFLSWFSPESTPFSDDIGTSRFFTSVEMTMTLSSILSLNRHSTSLPPCRRTTILVPSASAIRRKACSSGVNSVAPADDAPCVLMSVLCGKDIV
mmetsp:Transcript_37361/g.93749  ORF Transcript_37361/g.93749 Transcript_37361/m.93749 type:complete len:212 (-) Transcript_37361:336-971(-)